MELNAMTLPELKQLKKGVDKAIQTFEDRQKQAALTELEKKAADLGFSLSDLMGTGKVKKVSPPKYCNPADPSQTWTGRGRTPQWMKDLEAAGGSRESALI
jgi:DNA-binding protein H-NS